MNLELSCHVVGVSLVLNGETIPSDSFVDLNDIRIFGSGSPSNDNSDGALLCITDLIGCCASPAHGDWYFPNEGRVGENGHGFVVNRGASDQQNSTSGSVRLFRRFSYAPERGRFRCELPSAADPNTDLTLYVNISEFVTHCNYIVHACVPIRPYLYSILCCAGLTDSDFSIYYYYFIMLR